MPRPCFLLDPVVPPKAGAEVIHIDSTVPRAARILVVVAVTVHIMHRRVAIGRVVPTLTLVAPTLAAVAVLGVLGSGVA